MQIKKFNLIILSLTIFFIGCGGDTKKVVYEIKKASIVTIDAVDDITTKSFINQYEDNTEPIWIIKHSINYPNENNTGDIDDPYRLGFHFKRVDNIHDSIWYNYDLCNDGEKDYTENIKNYRGYSPLKDYKGVLHIYLAVETMISRGFVDDSFNSKGDICIYVKNDWKKMYDLYKYRSNTLIYTTEEINHALAEYKALQ